MGSAGATAIVMERHGDAVMLRWEAPTLDPRWFAVGIVFGAAGIVLSLIAGFPEFGLVGLAGVALGLFSMRETARRASTSIELRSGILTVQRGRGRFARTASYRNGELVRVGVVADSLGRHEGAFGLLGIVSGQHGLREEVLCGGFTSAVDARIVEREIERHLGIADGPTGSKDEVDNTSAGPHPAIDVWENLPGDEVWEGLGAGLQPPAPGSEGPTAGGSA